MYKVEGIGTDVLTRAMDYTVVDEVIQVDDRQAFLAARDLILSEGLLAGGSSGSVVAAINGLIPQLDTPKTIVTLLPDSAMRYLSKFLSDSWMQEQGF